MTILGGRPRGLTVLAAAGLTTAGAVALRARLRRHAVRPGRQESEALGVYLQDHLAGSRMAVELLGALRDQHAGEPMAQFAEHLRSEIDEDRTVLRQIIGRTDAGQGTMKQAAAWVGEKATRLKFERRVAGELGVLQALETLALGIHGKRALWRALSVLAAEDDRLRGVDYERLVERAEGQHARVEQRRLDYVRGVLAVGRPVAAVEPDRHADARADAESIH